MDTKEFVIYVISMADCFFKDYSVYVCVCISSNILFLQFDVDVPSSRGEESLLPALEIGWAFVNVLTSRIWESYAI